MMANGSRKRRHRNKHPPSSLRPIRITGDGRCLFRSIVYGVCLREGRPTANEFLQKELADDLRARVANEFIKRKKETEWFIEGDFDAYVLRMRNPYAWGGEPELLMCSHVLRMPITVYMSSDSISGLKVVAEYGQEYGTRQIYSRAVCNRYGDSSLSAEGVEEWKRGCIQLVPIKRALQQASRGDSFQR